MNTTHLPQGSHATLKNAKYFEEEAKVLGSYELPTRGQWGAEKLDRHEYSTIRMYRLKVIRTGKILKFPDSHLIETQAT